MFCPFSSHLAPAWWVLFAKPYNVCAKPANSFLLPQSLHLCKRHHHLPSGSAKNLGVILDSPSLPSCLQSINKPCLPDLQNRTCSIYPSPSAAPLSSPTWSPRSCSCPWATPSPPATRVSHCNMNHEHLTRSEHFRDFPLASPVSSLPSPPTFSRSLPRSCWLSFLPHGSCPFPSVGDAPPLVSM